MSPVPPRLQPGDPDYDPHFDRLDAYDALLFKDREGKPITLRQYLHLFNDTEYQVLAYEKIGEFEVSTIWLGMVGLKDQQGRDLIFETATNVLGEGFQPVLRYSTEADALEGHESFALLARGMDSKGLSLDDADVSGEQPNNEG